MRRRASCCGCSRSPRRPAGLRAPPVLAGSTSVEKAHPRERHLYLAVLGVEPSRQGEGLGSELLPPGLELCDREGIPAYLETAKERNVSFYSRHGFRVTDELRLPKRTARLADVARRRARPDRAGLVARRPRA